jgi:hypothetical protein
MEKERCCDFKAGQHGKEWRVRASSNGNKGGGGEGKKPGLSTSNNQSQARLVHLVM